MKINKDYMLTDSEAIQVTGGKGNTKKFLTIHETGNLNASSLNHAKLQKRLGMIRSKASWHYSVDDKEIHQNFEHSWKCWHTGTTAGNNTSIGIEICWVKDFDSAVKLAAQLAAKILKDENIPLSNMRQHYHWSKKNCPERIRSGKFWWTWDKFVALVKSYLNPTVQKKEEVKQPAVVKETTYVQVTADNLWTYNTANWTDKYISYKKGTTFTVVSTHTVAGAKMYKLKSGKYITASSKYVKVFTK
ncbi:N-acetylmuramoyl-L-alanine amidase [Lysinibacillus sp. FSL K6-0057]|uniref:N-acetylmuramoyl-L-alanine amidase n=1 Tax=Lysinibacillus sp. FSL K6-0057 TaxID=2921411 RepID=UPI00315AC06B